MKNSLLAILKPGHRLSLVLVALIILAVGMLVYFDLIEPARQVLESKRMTLKIAGVTLTAYQILSGLLAVVVLFWVANAASGAVEKSISRLDGLNSSNRNLLVKVVQVALYFILFMLALNMFGISLSAFAVFGGVLGVGIGLGLQKVTANFVSGVILLVEKSVRPGDLVELGGGISGFVRLIGIRHTRIETADGKEVMIPNEDFITSRVTNWTFSNRRCRIEMRVGVGYDSDLELAQRLMLEAAAAHPRCLRAPGPTCFLQEFADKSVIFSLFFWVEDVTDGRTEPRHEVLFEIWRKFREHGVDFSHPLSSSARARGEA